MSDGIPMWLRPVDNDEWYGTADHQKYEDMIDEAREATRGDEYQEPPAGTLIPGLGEI
jgi:hypothetical protein